MDKKEFTVTVERPSFCVGRGRAFGDWADPGPYRDGGRRTPPESLGRLVLTAQEAGDDITVVIFGLMAEVVVTGGAIRIKEAKMAGIF